MLRLNDSYPEMPIICAPALPSTTNRLAYEDLLPAISRISQLPIKNEMMAPGKKNLGPGSPDVAPLRAIGSSNREVASDVPFFIRVSATKGPRHCRGPIAHKPLYYLLAT